LVGNKKGLSMKDMKIELCGDLLDRKEALIFVLLVLCLFVVPLVTHSGFLVAVLIQYLFFSLLGMAWNMIGGYGGQVSFGMAQYVGIGAYTTALFLKWWDIPFWISMPAGALLAACWALIIGRPLFRLRGHYFAIATIAISLILQDIFRNWQLVGASRGIQLPFKRSPNLLYVQFANDTYYLWILLGLFTMVFLGLAYFDKSRLAYQLKAVRENQTLAESLGVNALVAKLKGYAIAAAIAAMAGSFYSIYNMFIDPDSVMDLMLSVKIALIPMLGGAGTMWGPLIGAAILVPLDRYLGVLLGGRGLDLVLYGLLIMLIAVIEPRGLWGIMQKIARRR